MGYSLHLARSLHSKLKIECQVDAVPGDSCRLAHVFSHEIVSEAQSETVTPEESPA